MGRKNQSMASLGHSTRTSLENNTDNGAVLLIGGMIMDIQAFGNPGYALRKGDSAPGTVIFTPGGVARNIGHTLVVLASSSGSKFPILFSVVGNDAAGNELIEHWKSIGADASYIQRQIPGRTPVVSVIFDATGDVAASIADVSLTEHFFTPETIMKMTDIINSISLLLVDGDLRSNAIETAVRMGYNAGKTVWFEPVSAAKAVRVIGCISYIDFISPNMEELHSLATSLSDFAQGSIALGDLKILNHHASMSRNCLNEILIALPDILVVLSAGVKNIVLTMGQFGAALCYLKKDEKSQNILEILHIMALSENIVSCSGAGDALVAGFIHGLGLYKENHKALACGMISAKKVVEDRHNVPETMTIEGDLDPIQIEKRSNLILIDLDNLTLRFVSRTRLRAKM